MTTMQLMRAISAADPSDLEHSERTVRSKGKTAFRLSLAAAVVALLTITVFAVPAIRNALFGVRTKQTYISRIFVDEGNAADVHESYLDVSLDIALDKSAPASIETYYIPMLPASQWEPIPLITREGQSPNLSKSTLLQWQTQDGSYVLFRQYAMPGYSAEQPFDSVCTGFDADYSIEQIELSSYIVQRITVEPSSKEALGFLGKHAGLQKLYWSNGDYIFTMEVNFDMSDATLADIFESITTTADVMPYLTIERQSAEIDLVPKLHQEAILWPDTLPEDCVQTVGVQTADGGYLFLWITDHDLVEPSVLALTIAPGGQNSSIMLDWETAAEDFEKEETTIKNIPVTCYQNAYQAELLWTYDGEDYSLKASGAQALSVQELLEILQSAALTDNIAAHLQEE